MQEPVSPQANNAPLLGHEEMVSHSRKFLDAVLHSPEQVPSFLSLLESLKITELEVSLKDDAAKKAFWINIYNAYNLHCMRLVPALTLKEKRRHFFQKRLKIGGRSWSLNEIEHGILRKSKLWWAKGYLSNPFAALAERKLRLEIADPRIHFALNCGAKSCPAIRFYSAEQMDSDLETASQAFIEAEVEWAPGSNTVYASSIFQMYIGDFGGRKGILSWIKKYRPDITGEALRVKFLPYNWTMLLDNVVY
jgi:hypothetical protein